MHDAIRHVNNLRLSLAHDKAPLGLLLAAGCSASVEVGGTPLIPAIAVMTQKLAEDLSAGPQAAAFARLLECLEEDGADDPNVENWLSLIRAMALVARGGEVRGLSHEDLSGLEEAVTGGIVSLVEKQLPAVDTPFHSVAAWAGAVERDQPIEIFTTNYDLLIEQAFESMRGPYFDGFVGVRRPFFDNASVSVTTTQPLPARFTRLWKLHGSVNWYVDEQAGVVRSEINLGQRRLIHPSHLKYDESRQMPYLALMDRLRAFLSQRGALLVCCGYSFGDEHINDILQDALQANPTASVIGLTRGKLEKYEQATTLASKRSNFGLYALDGGVIGTRNGPWSIEESGSGTLPAGILMKDDKPTVRLGDFVVFGQFLQSLLDVGGLSGS